MDFSNNNIFSLEEGNFLKTFDFNLYPMAIVEPWYQLFLIPSDNDIEDCYIVRKDDSSNGVRHSEFASQLVNNVDFQAREREEYIKYNGKTSCWITERQNYDVGEELSYLINKKGYILYSPPAKNSNNIANCCREFFPEDKSLLSKRECNNFLYLIERDSRMNVDPNLLNELYKLVSDKNKR